MDGSFGKATRSWAEIKNRAKELVKPQKVEPGFHYVVTDVVHCKSKEEKGVNGAIKKCPQRYLKRVLWISGARVIIVLGKRAGKVVRYELGISSKAKLYGPTGICGRRRYLVFMPRSGSNAKRKFSTSLSVGELRKLRKFLEFR